MKRLIWLLMAALLLTGCAGQNATDASTVSTTAPVPAGVYIPNGQAEQESGGAVRAYHTTGVKLYAMDNGIGILDDQGRLTLMNKETGVLKTACSAVTDLHAVSGNSVFYYDTAIHEYNIKTAEKKTWELPAEMIGDFAIGLQTREIYYCTAGQVCALNMDSGLSRMLKQHSSQQQSIVGAYFGGEVIGWETEDGISYLSCENGLTLHQDDHVFAMQTQQESYFARRMDGIVEQKIFGQMGAEAKQLNVDSMVIAPAFAQQGVVTANVDNGLKLSFYDTATGKKMAETVISREDNCLDVISDGQLIWALTETAIYSWDMSKSGISDDTVYTSPVWSAQMPDAESMGVVTQRIEQMQKTYGVKLHTGLDAVKNAQESMTPEHQAQTISMMLDALEPCLQLLPEGFLKNTVKAGWVRICLVRDVASETGYVRYWHDGDCYVAISLDADMQEAFLTGLGGAVDSHILGNSRDLEYWNDLNPQGFAYTHEQALPEEYEAYIPAYFADALSMTYGSEDRARIFLYAMTEGNEELFAQPVMQRKLILLCEGIRESYNYKKKTDVFPWEQYLEESLAYVEK